MLMVMDNSKPSYKCNIYTHTHICYETAHILSLFISFHFNNYLVFLPHSVFCSVDNKQAWRHPCWHLSYRWLTLNRTWRSSQRSWTKFISDSWGNTSSCVSLLNGILAWGSHAQWYGYALHESGCLKGNANPLSIAAIAISGDCTRFQSCWQDTAVNSWDFHLFL